MMMIKKWCLVLVVVSLVTSLNGCAGKRELDKLGIVNVAGVDRDPKTGGYRLMVQIMSPERSQGGMGGAQTKTWIATATGKTLMDASKNLRAIVSKKIVWFHSNLIIIGEEVAREGITKITDFFARNQEIRYSSWVVISDGKAKEVLKLNPRFSGSLAEEVEGLIDNTKVRAEGHVLNLKDLLIRLDNEQYDEVTGRITDYYPKIEPEGTYEQENLVKELPKKEKRIVALSGMSVLKDGKLQGWLNRIETRGYLWITDEMEGGTVVEIISQPELKMADAKPKISAEILEASSSLTPQLKGDEISFELEVTAGVGITEQIAKLDLTKEENINQMETMIAGEIKKNIESALKKAQLDYEADIFGYGTALYRAYPQQWEEIKDEWDQIFPTVKTKIKVDVTIKRLGMISKPISN
ncbi:Ger(x)C family spore germination protein [Halanaerobaculum tunisiense]